MASRYRMKLQKRGGPFPIYNPEEPHLSVTAALLELAKPVAVEMFRKGSVRAATCYRRSICRRYRCKPSSVRFRRPCDTTRRIRSAELCTDDECIAKTDGFKIWVSDSHHVTFAEVVGALVHEALHSWCYVKSKGLPTDYEHDLMRTLGDEW